MKIIGFAGSNSKTSINQQLVKFALEQIKDHETELLNLNQYEIPMYGIDFEKEVGFPKGVEEFINKLKSADKLIIATSEHNQHITAFFKNILDWCSRKELKFLEGKSILLLSTSPGGYGGQNARNYAEKALPKFGSTIENTFSLPSFQLNFANGEVSNEDFKNELLEKITKFIS